MAAFKEQQRGRRSVQDIVLRSAIRRALKAAPEFRRGGWGFLVLVAPPGHRPPEYLRSLADEIPDFNERGSDCGVVVVNPKENHELVLSQFEDECRSRGRAVLVVPSRDHIPVELRVAADVTVDIEDMQPSDIRLACRAVLRMRVTPDQAIAALRHPSPLLFATLRKGRTMAEVLARMKNAPTDIRAIEVEAKGEAQRSKPDIPALEDLHGYGAAKDWGIQLARDIADWQAGIIGWEDVPCGLLLSGPPGVGKTIYAKAVAKQCGIELVAASLAKWQARGHLGDLLKAMRLDFAKAKESAPAILFIDELDSVGDRTQFKNDYADYSIQVVNALLESIDGVDGREGVIVIGATNNPERIDVALRRSGRFENHIQIGLPDGKARISIIEQKVGALADDELKERVRHATAGFSGADLDKVCRDARRSARTARRAVTAADLLENLPKLTPVVGEMRHLIAVHEAGHVTVGTCLDYGTFAGAYIPNWLRTDAAVQAGGAAAFYPDREILRTAQDFKNEVASILAGAAAEELILGVISEGSGGGPGSDLDKATDLATIYEAMQGFGGRLRFSSMSGKRDVEELRRSDRDLAERVETLLREQYERAKTAIAENRRLFDAIVAELESTGSLAPTRLLEIQDEMNRSGKKLRAGSRRVR